MHCTDCHNYNRAKGCKACLKCPQYQDIIKISGKRTTIAIDIVPDIILEAVPDNHIIDIRTALEQLPLELSTPLLMYHILKAPLREIANYHNYDISTASRKINIAIDIVKKMLIFND